MSSQQEFEEFLQQAQFLSKPRGFGQPPNVLYKFGLIIKEVPVPRPAPRGVPLSFSGPVSASEPTDGPSVHRGVSCDMCGVGPIVGVRFKCTGRDDFDLCSSCEAKSEQPFPMLKLYEPKAGLCLNVKGVGFRCKGRRPRGGGSDGDASAFPAPPQFEGPVIHEGVTCDECHVGPIVGIRYKCTGRENYDLCASCEGSKPKQPFPTIKIYHPDITVHVKGWGSSGRQCPVGPFGNPNLLHGGRRSNGCGRWRQGCGRGDAAEGAWPRQTDVAETIATVVDSVANAANSFMDGIDQQILKQTMEMSMQDIGKGDKTSTSKCSTNVSPSSSFSAGIVKGYALKPMARFVGDITIPDATIIAPSTDFVKIWLVRNDGPCDWPEFGEGVRLVTAGGDPMCDTNLSIPVDCIKVGTETHISVTLKSPPTAGRYVAYFRLQAADGIVFGQKLWVDIRVQPTAGHIGFTSPAFSVARQSQVKDAEKCGLESKATEDIPLPVTRAIASATLPFIPAAPVSVSTVTSDDVDIMEFPGGDFEDVTPPIPPSAMHNSDAAISPIVNEENKWNWDEDAQWEADRDELEREWKVELDALRGMGFHNARENVKLLKKHTKCSFARFPQLQGKPFSDTLSTILDALLH